VKEVRTKPAVAFKPPVNVVGDAVVAPDLGKQFGDEARGLADSLDLPLASELTRILRFLGRERI
jgi:hypothetical protein